MKSTNTDISMTDKCWLNDAVPSSYASKFGLMHSRGTCTDSYSGTTNLGFTINKYMSALPEIRSEALNSVTTDLKNYDIVAMAPIAEERNNNGGNETSVKGNPSLKEIFHISTDTFESNRISGSLQGINTPIHLIQSASDLSLDVKDHRSNIADVLKISIHPTPYEIKQAPNIGIKKMHLTNHPTVLRITPSRNFLVILDKEFAKESSKLIVHFIGPKNKRIVKIVDVKESEICLIINDDDDDTSRASINDVNKALIVINASGNIKLSVNAPRSMADELDEKSSQMKNVRSPVFKEMINRYVQDSKSEEEMSDIDLQLLKNEVQRLRSERSCSIDSGEDPDLVTIYLKEKHAKRSSFSTLISKLSEKTSVSEGVPMEQSTHLLNSNLCPKDKTVSTICDKKCDNDKCECRYLELDTDDISINSTECLSSIINEDDCQSITLSNAVKSQCGCRLRESGNLTFNEQCFHVNVDQTFKASNILNKKSKFMRVSSKDFRYMSYGGKRFPRILE